MKFALIVSFLVTSLALNAQTIQGKVVRVVDGDTIMILDEAKVQHKFRANRIDAPEKSQAFGEVPRKYLANMVAGKLVKIEWAKNANNEMKNAWRRKEMTLCSFVRLVQLLLV